MGRGTKNDENQCYGAKESTKYSPQQNSVHRGLLSHSQYHQRYTYEFFERTSFRQLFLHTRNEKKSCRNIIRTYNVYEIDTKSLFLVVVDELKVWL